MEATSYRDIASNLRFLARSRRVDFQNVRSAEDVGFLRQFYPGRVCDRGVSDARVYEIVESLRRREPALFSGVAS